MSLRDRRSYRADEKNSHALLEEEERRRLIGVSATYYLGRKCVSLLTGAQKYMPAPKQVEAEAPKPASKAPPKRKSCFGLRNLLKGQLHFLIFALMHSIFSLYIKLRKAWHTVSYSVRSVMFYHHRTPELIENDVRGLGKKPKHLSTVLEVEEEGRATELERLVGEAADVAVWSACAGIPTLSIYERSGKGIEATSWGPATNLSPP